MKYGSLQWEGNMSSGSKEVWSVVLSTGKALYCNEGCLDKRV